jgi:peroxiredoxin
MATIASFSIRRLLIALIGLAVFMPTAVAQQTASKVGDVVPDWQDLVGVDDQQHSLKDWKEKQVLVICFTCNSCPYAVDYEDRLNALHRKIVSEKLDAQLIAINSNTIPADRLDEMKKRATDKEFGFPYLWDETQDVARAYGAIYTPEFFVLNRDRKIVYKGAMDDSTNADAVSSRFVELAVTAALKGEQPEVTEAGARGCTIRFQRQRRKP